MTNFVVSSDVPIPKVSRGRGARGSKYPFATLEVGDSFLVPAPVKAITLRSAVNAFRKSAANAEDMKFTIRGVEDGVRVWRVQ